MANAEVVNFDTMRDMVLNGGTIESKERFQFKWGTLTKDIITHKMLQDVLNLRLKKISMDLILNLLCGGGDDFEFYPKGEAHGFFDDWIQTI